MDLSKFLTRNPCENPERLILLGLDLLIKEGAEKILVFYGEGSDDMSVVVKKSNIKNAKGKFRVLKYKSKATFNFYDRSDRSIMFIKYVSFCDVGQTHKVDATIMIDPEKLVIDRHYEAMTGDLGSTQNIILSTNERYVETLVDEANRRFEDISDNKTEYIEYILNSEFDTVGDLIRGFFPLVI